MELRLYDTLTREKRPFEPLDPASVRMYVCGPTVYDFAHIGNARPVIVFDVLFRLLRHLYGAEAVVYARNITDVDDKINARAAERIASRDEAGANLNAEIRTLTDETYKNFAADVAELNGDFIADLTLDGEVELVADARTEVRIQAGRGARRNGVHAGKIRLWKSLTGDW